MKIIDQSLDHIAVYSAHGRQIHKKLRYESLADVLLSCKKDVEKKATLTFLLDEQLFSYHHVNIQISLDTPCSISFVR
jgi:hypothetical protein